MAEWKVGGSNPACHACKRRFAAEERFYSALYFVPPEIERRDLCPDCWENLTPSETLAYWTLQVPDEETVEPDVGPLDLTRMKRMIRVDLQKPTAPPGLAGLISLMMARRRLARIEAIGDHGLSVRFKDEDEAFHVPAPNLQGPALERAQAALWEILDQLAGG